MEPRSFFVLFEDKTGMVSERKSLKAPPPPPLDFAPFAISSSCGLGGLRVSVPLARCCERRCGLYDTDATGAV